MGAGRGRGLPARDAPRPSCSARDPLQIEAINASSSDYLGWRSHRRGDARQLGDRHRALGHVRQGDRPAGLRAAGRHARRDRIRIYNTCAGYKYIRDDARQAVANWGLGRTATAPTRTSKASCIAPTSWPMSLLEQGITGMKIWPFDIAAERTGG